MFKAYICFELKRQFTSLKTIVVAAAFFLGLVGYLLYSAYMHREAHARHMEYLQVAQADLSHISSRIRMERHHEHFQAASARTEEETDALLAMVNEDVRRIAAQRFHAELDNPDLDLAPAWERVLNENVLRYERLLTNFYRWRATRAAYLNVCVTEIDFNDPHMEEWYRPRFTELSLIDTARYFRYLQNTNTPPVYSNHDPTAFQLVHRIIAVLGVFLLPVLTILLTADNFSKDSDSSGYKLVLLQPLSRGKVYLAKLFGSFVVCLAVFVLPLLLLFVTAGAVFGFGAGGYPARFMPADIPPAAYYETAAEVLARINPVTQLDGFVTVGTYPLRMFPFIALYILFMVSLTSFISMSAKDGVFAFAAALGIVLANFLMMEFAWGVALWNPIAYSDVNYIITAGHVGLFGYVVLCTLVPAAVGIAWFGRKDVV